MISNIFLPMSNSECLSDETPVIYTNISLRVTPMLLIGVLKKKRCKKRKMKQRKKEKGKNL
jgi:hypothetical protein